MESYNKTTTNTPYNQIQRNQTDRQQISCYYCYRPAIERVTAGTTRNIAIITLNNQHSGKLMTSLSVGIVALIIIIVFLIWYVQRSTVGNITIALFYYYNILQNKTKRLDSSLTLFFFLYTNCCKTYNFLIFCYYCTYFFVIQPKL
jgi:hypothetical protein